MLLFSFLVIINSVFVFGCSPTEKPSYAKVVVLSGQSNMFGCSSTSYLTPESIGRARYNKLSNPIKNVKILMKSGNAESDFTPIQIGVGDDMKNYFGPELGIAEYLSNKYNENIYVIKFAVGGSSLYQDWISESRGGQISYNYKILTDLIDNGLSILEQANLNPKIVGFCWMQGETDGSFDSWTKEYYNNLSTFVGDLRNKYNAKSLGENLNFVDAKIGTYWTHYQEINNTKTRFSQTSNNNHLIDTLAPNLVDAGVDGLRADEEPHGAVDPMHYDSKSMLKLGELFGEEIFKIANSAIKN